MKTVSTIVGLALLASCTSLNIDGARLSVGASDIRARAEVEDAQGTRTDEVDVDSTNLNLELTNVLDSDSEVGLLFGYGQGDLGEVEGTTYDVGAVARQFLLDGNSIRPYVEGRIGYRRAELYDPVLFGRGSSDMLNLGAGVGVQFQATDRFAFFVQGNYDYAIGDRFSTQGPGLMVGGAITF
jgi:hypothetical protein